MKRILYIHHAWARTGACVTLRNALLALDRTRYAPVVACPTGASAAMFRAAGAEVHEVERPVRMVRHVSSYSWPAWSHVFWLDVLRQRRDLPYWRALIASLRVDLVQLGSLVLAPLAPAARAAGVPVVCIVQETFARGLVGARTRWLQHLLSTQMAGVWFISEHDRRASGCRAPIAEVIPNWVDAESLASVPDRRAARATLGIDDAREVVLTMGGVATQKGTPTAIEAASRSTRPRLLLLIAGPTVDAGPSARSTLARLERAGRVRTLGHVEQIAPCYAAADVVLFCPPEAHQGRPILEAGAFGRPVVVSDFRCVDEFVREGYNGLRVPPGDARALAASVNRLLGDDEERARMGLNNAAVAKRLHDARENGARMNAFYARVLAGR